MKKSITISVSIILAVVVITLYKGAHQHLTAFDAMLFATMFFIGILAGRGTSKVEEITVSDSAFKHFCKSADKEEYRED